MPKLFFSSTIRVNSSNRNSVDARRRSVANNIGIEEINPVVDLNLFTTRQTKSKSTS